MEAYKFFKNSEENGLVSYTDSHMLFFSNSTGFDYYSEESQLDMIELEDNIHRCRDCYKPWTQPNSIEMWHKEFRLWLDTGSCDQVPRGLDPFYKVINRDDFNYCLNLWFASSSTGRAYKSQMHLFSANDNLHGYRFKLDIIQLAGLASDGTKLLEDVRRITKEYGTNETYAYYRRFFEIEQYVIFLEEQITGVALSLCAVFVVVGFITLNLRVTLLVIFSVLLVDYFLIALMYYWGLTLNSFTGVNMIFALGLAVDYSSHIAHNFLLTKPPKSCVTDRQKRQYKAKIAVSQMGSSVFHGGASTFISISVLGFSDSYAFSVFFKTWIGIVVFGIGNGFLLLPIILSEIGPLVNYDDDDEAEKTDEGK